MSPGRNRKENKAEAGLAGLKRRSLGGEVTDIIRRRILTGEYRPRERLVELNLAEDLGISRTPVREALHRLEQEGILIRRPRGGYEVRPLTAGEVEDVEGVRGALEAYAAELAARNATDEHLEALADNLEQFQEALENDDNGKLLAVNTAFHHLLHLAAGSSLLSRMLADLEDTVERISRAILTTMPAGEWSCGEHREVYEAIRKGDGETAGRLARDHVERGGRWIVERMRTEKLEV